jgi:uncharacterized protein (DUF58 family)
MLRFNTSVQLTLGGLIFLTILLVVCFAAWNTGNNLLFLVFSLLASTMFVTWAAARLSLRDLSVTARFPDHIFADEPARIAVILRNGKRMLPSLSIRVDARTVMEGGNGRKITRVPLAYFIYTPHRVRAEQHVERTFERRGKFQLKGFELSTGFPFGFVRYRNFLSTRELEMIVYPAIKPIDEIVALLPRETGSHIRNKRGSGNDLFSLRDYQPADDPRHIDWKLTAKSLRIIVREFTPEYSTRVQVIFDTRLLSKASKSKDRFEAGVSLAASIIYYFIEAEAEISLNIGNETIGYDSGQQHLYKCLLRLAVVNPVSSEDISPIETGRRDEYRIAIVPREKASEYEHSSNHIMEY